MTWKPKDEKGGNYFERPEKEAQKLSIGIAGEPETGKTHFGCTCPEPVYILDTEFGARPVAIKDEFMDKDIQVAEIPVLDEEKEEPDPIASLKRLEGALKSIDDSKGGTIVLDSGTDIWKWIQAWLEDRQDVKTNKLGKPYRFEWAKANERYRNIWLLAQIKDMHLVVTGQIRDKYDSEGKATGGTEARWQKQTPHWVDVFLKVYKTYEKVSKDGEVKIQYKAKFEKCRFQRSFEQELEDVTFQNLKGTLEDNFGVKIAE